MTQTPLRDLQDTVIACTRPTIPGGPSIAFDGRTPGVDVVEINEFAATEALEDDEQAAGVVDVVFLQVAFTPDCHQLEPAGLLQQIHAAHHGEFTDITVDELRGEPQSYLRLGGWIGDQGLALRFMALCTHKGIGRISTARDLVADAMAQSEGIDREQAYDRIDATGSMTPRLVRQYAGQGMLWLQLHPEPADERSQEDLEVDAKVDEALRHPSPETIQAATDAAVARDQAQNIPVRRRPDAPLIPAEPRRVGDIGGGVLGYLDKPGGGQ